MSRGGKERFLSEAGDSCASKFERDVVNSLLRRDIAYEYEPMGYVYSTPVRSGRCFKCGSADIRQKRIYTPDLLLIDSGRIVECKGYFPAPSRNKMSCFVKSNRGTLIVSFAFMADRKLSKASHTRYSGWAHKLGCDFIIGTEIPESWASK